MVVTNHFPTGMCLQAFMFSQLRFFSTKYPTEIIEKKPFMAITVMYVVICQIIIKKTPQKWRCTNEDDVLRQCRLIGLEKNSASEIPMSFSKFQGYVICPPMCFWGIMSTYSYVIGSYYSSPENPTGSPCITSLGLSINARTFVVDVWRLGFQWCFLPWYRKKKYSRNVSSMRTHVSFKF